jgi:hypothetical protein
MSSRERILIGLLFTGLPILIYGMVIKPSNRRMAALRQRILAANEQYKEFHTFQPVTQEEKDFLEAPSAPWRTRITKVGDDGALLAHVDRVVSELNATLKAKGLAIAAVRANLEPVKANCTLPQSLTKGAAPLPAGADTPETQVGGWVLEVQIPGPPGTLFKTLAALPDVNPLLEPVGLRWDATAAAGRDEDHPGPRQYLLLRNVYLKP